MKVILIISCLLFCNSSGFAQKLKAEKRVTDHSIYVKGNCFEGVVFQDQSLKSTISINKPTRNYLLSNFLLLFGADTSQYKVSFALSATEVIYAESLLRNYVSELKPSPDNKFIKANLHKYLRQYLGYINKNGDKVVFVKCLWKRSITDMEKQESSTKKKKWTNDVIFIEDGGCYYWQIKINLNSDELFDFRVNGTV